MGLFKKATVTIEIQKPEPELSYLVVDVPATPHDCTLPALYVSDKTWKYGTHILCKGCQKEYVLLEVTPEPLTEVEKAARDNCLKENPRMFDFYNPYRRDPHPKWIEVTESYKDNPEESWWGRPAYNLRRY